MLSLKVTRIFNIKTQFFEALFLFIENTSYALLSRKNSRYSSFSAHFSGELLEVVFKPKLVKNTLFQKYYVTWGEGGGFTDTTVGHEGGGGSKSGLKQGT